MNWTLELNNIELLDPAEAHCIFAGLTMQFSPGWTGIVGPHRSGKTALLRLAAGQEPPTTGRVRLPGAAIYCPADLARPPLNLAELLATPDRSAAQLVGRLALAGNWLERWSQLQEQERRRAQIACALWIEPAVLVLDEPTGNMDSSSKAMLLAVLARFRGIGLVASADRDLLNTLCHGCVTLGTGTPILRKGTYSQARIMLQRDLEALRRQKQNARHDLATLSATVDIRRQKASEANLKRSKRFLDRHDHDSRQKLDSALKRGKDARAGQLLKQLNGRLAQAQQRARNIDVQDQPKLPPDLAGQPAAIEILCHTQAYNLPLNPDNTLHLLLPELIIGRCDRIAITGPWECGTTPLANRIATQLLPAPLRVTYLPKTPTQWIQTPHAALQCLPPKMQEPATLAAACLGCNVERLLEHEQWPADDLWKLTLAIGLAHQPNLILLEEPETILDLPSLEQLESILDKCSCALILISHDAPLLQRTTRQTWQITAHDGTYQLTISYPGSATPAAAGH